MGPIIVAAAGSIVGLIGLAIYESRKQKFQVNALTQVGLGKDANLIGVQLNGETWLVSPTYAFPMGIGEAFETAKSLGMQLPTPALVDAIWAAADLKIVPPIRATDGTPRTMSSQATFEAQQQRIDKLIDGRSFRLLDGTHKNVVMLPNGKPGLYGWNTDAPPSAIVDQNGRPAGIALHSVRGATGAKVTAGQVIQQEFGGHGLDWKDYSQGLRLVKKAT